MIIQSIFKRFIPQVILELERLKIQDTVNFFFHIFSNSYKASKVFIGNLTICSQCNLRQNVRIDMKFRNGIRVTKKCLYVSNFVFQYNMRTYELKIVFALFIQFTYVENATTFIIKLI